MNSVDLRYTKPNSTLLKADLMNKILDHKIISERYFFPRYATFPNTKWVDANDMKLSCFQGEKKNPILMLHFHGNGETVADYLPTYATIMDSLGADVFMAEYRGYGESDGVPTLGSMLDDVEHILDATGRPDSEVIVFGRSVGSIYAIELAARRPNIAGLVLESGIADPKQRILLRTNARELGVTTDELNEAFSTHLDHEKKMKTYKGPLLILHAVNDHLVGIDHAEQNLAWSASEQKECVRFPWGDHNSIFHENREAYLKSLGEFFKSVQK